MSKSHTDANGVTRTFGKVTIDEVKPGFEGSNHDQVQLRQVITKDYPATRGGDSLSSSLFAPEDFGKGESYTENRVTWVKIPKGTTLEDAQKRIDANPNAKIMRILSLEPILSEEQKQAMASGLSDMTIEDYKEKQVVREPSEEGQIGAKILYKGQPQYKVNKFHTDDVEDEDLRPYQIDAILGRVSVAEKREVTEKAEQFS